MLVGNYSNICKLSAWFYKKSKNNLVLLLLLAVFLSFQAFLFQYIIKLYGLQDHVILDLNFGFNPEFAFDVISGYGERGRQGIMVFTGIVDMIYPLVYGSLLVLLISRFRRKVNPGSNTNQTINLLPFVAVLFDFMENTGILIMIQNYPGQNIPVAWLTSFAGMFKWIFLGISVLILLFFLITTLIQWIK